MIMKTLPKVRCKLYNLRCNGSPQCPGAEDEEDCIEEYFRREVVARHASFVCRSAIYPAMLTVATACNEIAECSGREDEQHCTDTSVSTLLLVASSVLLMTVCLGGEDEVGREH